MKVQTTATVVYTCYLDEGQTRAVMEYAKEHDCDLDEAVSAMYDDYNIELDLYHDSTESDFSTESIDFVELDEEDNETYEKIFGETAGDLE